MYIKSCFYSFGAMAVILLASCNDTFNTGTPPPSIAHATVVVQQLTFSKPTKIAWADVKAEPARPTVTKLAWDKLPEQVEDTTSYKSFKYPVQEAKFDYSGLPGKTLDIDKLSSQPLKFKTYLLPQPKLIKGVRPEMRGGNLFLLRVGSDQTGTAVAITRLLRDRDGFLWISCNQGLYRFDGEDLWLIYSYQEEQEDYGMIQDGEGNFWLPDPRGPLMILEPKAGILKKALPNTGANGLQHLMYDDRQRVWATTQSDEVRIIDIKSQTVKILDNKHGLSTASRTAGIAKDRSGKIWISTGGGGIDIVDVTNKEIKYLDQANGLQSNRVNNIAFDHKGRLWVGLFGGWVQVIDNEKKCIQTIGEAQSADRSGFVTSLSEDNKGHIWIGTTKSGAVAIDIEKHLVMHLNKAAGIASNFIADIMHDNGGRILLATDSGLNMVVSETALLEYSGHNPVTNLMEDQHGLIWQGTLHGIDILDRRKHTTRHLGVKEGLASDTVYFIEEKNNAIFISTAASMEIVDTVKKTITHFESNYSNILFDKAGRIYFLDHDESGINIYDPKDQTIKHFGRAVLQFNAFIYFLSLDAQDRIWISGGRGDVAVIDPDAGTIRYVSNIQHEKKDTWVHFLIDNRGNLWMGTANGIYIADTKDQKLVYFSTAQGLITNKVTSMVLHGSSVYAGTDLGITIITPPVGNITESDKWQAVSYSHIKQSSNSYNADLVTRDGAYWSGDFGTSALALNRSDSSKSIPFVKGISVFDHPLYFFDEKRFNPSSADTLWQAGGEASLPADATPVNTSYAFRSGFRWDTVAGLGNMPANLEIPYNQNFLHFQYSNLYLAPHDTTRYRYILNGFDKDWSGPTSDTTTVNYMNLPPGNYSFEVISTNANNTWSAPASFSFTINPPWWKTWWAYFIYAAIIVGAIRGFVHYRSLQLIKEKRELEDKVHLATEEIVQQNEEIAAQRDSLESQRNDLEKALAELKATQTQLIQSEKMASLGELTAGIAHEIQNPLNFVINFSEISAELIGELKEEIAKGEIEEATAIATDVEQNLEKIRHHGKRADSIVKGMLEHSRTSTGRKGPTDINKLADEYFRLAYHGLKAKDKGINAELITNFDEKLPLVNVIPQDMGRVLLNLFNNAFYAVNQKKKTAGTDYKPEVTVTTLSERNNIIIKVKDNGIGISDSIKEKIMQPFFTTKPTGEGTGLGLSLSYDIVVKGHGGSIKVETKEGEYTEFIVRFPIGILT